MTYNKLYLLAHYLQDVELQQHIVDTMIDRWTAEMGSLPPVSAVKRVYEHTAKDSGLRRLLVDVHIAYMSSDFPPTTSIATRETLSMRLLWIWWTTPSWMPTPRLGRLRTRPGAGGFLGLRKGRVSSTSRRRPERREGFEEAVVLSLVVDRSLVPLLKAVNPCLWQAATAVRWRSEAHPSRSLSERRRNVVSVVVCSSKCSSFET